MLKKLFQINSALLYEKTDLSAPFAISSKTWRFSFMTINLKISKVKSMLKNAEMKLFFEGKYKN